MNEDAHLESDYEDRWLGPGYADEPDYEQMVEDRAEYYGGAYRDKVESMGVEGW